MRSKRDRHNPHADRIEGDGNPSTPLRLMMGGCVALNRPVCDKVVLVEIVAWKGFERHIRHDGIEQKCGSQKPRCDMTRKVKFPYVSGENDAR